MRLTKKTVEAAEPRATQYTLWCSDLKGFGVKVNTAGSRSYFVDYRTREGIRRRSSLGRHGVLTTDEARKLALEILAQSLRGQDPQEERRTRRRSLTVAQLCDRYMAAARNGLILGRGGEPKKASTLGIDHGRIEQHIKPLLGSRLVVELTRAQMYGFVRDVTEGRTARVEASNKLRGRFRISGGPGAAARTSGLLGGILSYAVAEGIIENNPAGGLKRPAGNKRSRRLSPAEFSAFGRALQLAGDDPTKAWQGSKILRFAALTGCRIGEAQSLQWDAVDQANQVLVLNESKTGRSIRPLGRPALDLLESIDHDGDFVFPAPRLRAAPFAGIKRYYRWLFASAGLSGVTPHVLRHSFASVAADMGFADATIGACLGHAGSSTTSRYTHRLDAVLVSAADKIAAEVQRQMQAKPVSDTARGLR